MKLHFRTILLTLIICGCGGGMPPKYLRTPRVEINTQIQDKKLWYENRELNLVTNIIIDKNVSGQPEKVHLLSWGRGAKNVNIQLSVIGSDAGKIIFKSMDAGGVTDMGATPRGSFVRISSDFDGDGLRDKLTNPKDGHFIITNSSDQIIGDTIIESDKWNALGITSNKPHYILISIDEFLLIFDGHLKNVAKLRNPRIKAPLRLVAGEWMGVPEKSHFVSLFKGHAGWHKSILFVHSRIGDVIYKEILNDDYLSLAPFSNENGEFTFLSSVLRVCES